MSTPPDSPAGKAQNPVELAFGAVRRLARDRDELHITPAVDAAAVRAHLREVYGDFGEAIEAEALLGDAEQMMRSWNLHITHPRYFGLFNPSVVPAAVAADLLVAAFNPQLAAWSHAPAANEIERYTLDWFARRLGLPPETRGHFTSGGAEANHTAITVALSARLPGHSESGLVHGGARPMVYVSREAHHSFDKVVRSVGLGRRSLRHVAVDSAHRMDAQALERAIREDRDAGRRPLIVVATAGTTGGGAVDPLEAIAAICEREQLWLHVDAAWGGAACLSEKLQPLLTGIGHAQSVTWDAHKFLSVPMGAGMFFCTEPQAIHSAFGAETPYMPPGVDDTDDPYSTSLQWSRRHIGLKVFLALAALGSRGYAELIEHQTAMADLLRRRLVDTGWQVRNRTPLPLVCFTHWALQEGEPETHAALAEELVERLRVRNFWLSTIRLDGGRPLLRACVTSFRTQESDIEALVEALSAVLAAVSGD